MGALSLKIPEDVVASLRIPSTSWRTSCIKSWLRRSIREACSLPARQQPSAALPCQQFEDLLGKRKILRHYGEEELEEDLEYACRGL